MKTTLNYNTIESFQQQPEWKRFLDVLVNTCKRYFDKNLLGYMEQGNSLKRVDENTDIQPCYPTLSYKNDLMPLNIMENISLKGLMRILGLYGCKLLDVETNVTIPHTFKVQGQNREGDLWGYHNKNKNYDYEARSIDEDNVDDVETGYYFPSMSSNYFDEDKRFKYIYNIYGYNQKEPMMCYSEVYEVKQVRQLNLTSDLRNKYNVTNVCFILDDDVLDVSNNIFKTGSKVYSQSGKEYNVYLTGDKANNILQSADCTIATSVPLSDGIIKEPVFYIINDNDKIDLVDANGIIRYNSPTDTNSEYNNLRGLASKNINDVIEIKLTKVINESIESNFVTYQVYLVNIYPNRYVVSNTIKRKLTDLNPYYSHDVLFNGDTLIKAQPVFTYTLKDKLSPLYTASYTYNDFNIRGGENLPSYQFVSYKYKSGGIDFEKNVPTLHADYDSLYERSINNKVGEGLSNNIKQRDGGGSQVSISGTTLQGMSTPSASLGNKYKICNVYNVKLDTDDNIYKPSQLIGEFYYIGDIVEDNEIFIFNKNDVFNTLMNTGRRTPVLKKYSNNLYYIRCSQNINSGGYANTSIENTDYVIEDLYKQEFVETMYFNHFVKLYPITSTNSDTIVETNKVYCDNLELLQYGDMIPYIVTYLRKGELDENNKFIDLDCSIFSKIMAYNKYTHLVTLNNNVCFPNSYDPIYAVVAYQNIYPFSKPLSLKVLAPNDGVKSIVKPLVDEMFSDRLDIDFYSQSEYDDMLFWEQHEKQKKVDNNRVNIMLQELDNKYKTSYGNYCIFGLVSDIGKTISLEINVKGQNITKTCNTAGSKVFHFDYSDLTGTGWTYFDIDYITIGGDAKYITCIRISNNLSRLKAGGVLSKGTFKNCENLCVISNYAPTVYVNNDFDYNANLNNLLFIDTSPTFSVSNAYDGINVFNYYSGMSNIYNLTLDNVRFNYNKVDFYNAFRGCSKLEKISMNFNKTIYAVNIDSWFEGCESLRELVLTNIDFSQCKSAKNAFKGCKHLERIIVNWGNNTVITNIDGMFEDCRNLTSIGDFSGWYGDSISMYNTFRNCSTLKNVLIKNMKAESYTNGMFENCGAETIGFYATPYPSNEKVSLVMPNLKTIEYCNEIFDVHSDSNDIKVEINTPNLTRDSFLRFMSKQFTNGDDVTDYGYNVALHRNIIERLIIGTDIEVYEIDENGAITTYRLLNHVSSMIYIHPLK